MLLLSETRGFLGLLRLAGLFCLLIGLAACDPAPKLKPLPAEGRVLAFGDSLTAGVGVESGDSYPAVLKSLIGREVVNAGQPGESTAAGVGRLAWALSLFQPDLLILCHGFDDMQRRADYGETEKNVRAMVDLARSRGIEVILVAAPQIRALIAPALFYSLIALDTGVSFEPAVVSHIFNDDALTFNRMYPNERGYRVLAEALAARLRKQGAL